MEIWSILILVVIVGGPIALIIYQKTGYNILHHAKKATPEGEQIIDIGINEGGVKGEHHFVATVYFTDGTSYYGACSDRKDLFLGYTISLSEAKLQYVAREAILAHRAAVMKNSGLDRKSIEKEIQRMRKEGVDVTLKMNLSEKCGTPNKNI